MGHPEVCLASDRSPRAGEWPWSPSDSSPASAGPSPPPAGHRTRANIREPTTVLWTANLLSLLVLITALPDYINILLYWGLVVVRWLKNSKSRVQIWACTTEFVSVPPYQLVESLQLVCILMIKVKYLTNLLDPRARYKAKISTTNFPESLLNSSSGRYKDCVIILIITTKDFFQMLFLSLRLPHPLKAL